MSQDPNKKPDPKELKEPKKPDPKEIEDKEPQSVGVRIDITLNGFNGDQPIRAKIDTGAEASSLHGTNIDVSSDDVSQSSTVRFSYGDYTYNMPVVAFQSITSADGGTVNRPVVSIPARINGQYIDDAVFNLNDRGNMDYPVLIGLDLIKSAKLTIDPSISEMEVTFGPNGFEKVDGTPNVDETNKEDDNTKSDPIDDKFVQWYHANKGRTLEQVLMDLIEFDSTKEKE